MIHHIAIDSDLTYPNCGDSLDTRGWLLVVLVSERMGNARMTPRWGQLEGPFLEEDGARSILVLGVGRRKSE